MPIELKWNYGEHKIGNVVTLSSAEEDRLIKGGYALEVKHAEVVEEKTSEDKVNYNVDLLGEEAIGRTHNSDRTIEEVEEYIEAVNDSEELKALLAEEKESKKPRKGAIEIIEARLKEVNEDES